jgi:hypothetical protein
MPASCTGGGCTAQNPDRVTQPCSGASCYKRTRKHKPAAASEKIRYFEIIRAVDDLRIDVQIGGRATIAPPERRQMYFDM